MTTSAPNAHILASWFVDRSLADTWKVALPGALVRWSWFRSAVAASAESGGRSLGLAGSIAPSALSAAFGSWVELLDRERRQEQVDPSDFARYACGMLWRGLLLTRPFQLEPSGQASGGLPDAVQRQPQAALALRVSLTALDAWHRAIGAAPVTLCWPAHGAGGFIASCLENVNEDANQAPPFLDALTGAEPNWLLPTQLADRPAMRRARESGLFR